MEHLISIGTHSCTAGDGLLIVIGAVIMGLVGRSLQLDRSGIGVVVIIIAHVKANLQISDLVNAIVHQAIIAEFDGAIGLFPIGHITVQVAVIYHESIDRIAAVTHRPADKAEIFSAVVFNGEIQFGSVTGIDQPGGGNFYSSFIQHYRLLQRGICPEFPQGLLGCRRGTRRCSPGCRLGQIRCPGVGRAAG